MHILLVHLLGAATHLVYHQLTSRHHCLKHDYITIIGRGNRRSSYSYVGSDKWSLKKKKIPKPGYWIGRRYFGQHLSHWKPSCPWGTAKLTHLVFNHVTFTIFTPHYSATFRSPETVIAGNVIDHVLFKKNLQVCLSLDSQKCNLLETVIQNHWFTKVQLKHFR